MRTYDYLLGISMLALVACNQENMPERPTPTPGAEVKFGVSLNKTDVTRTIYGEENTEKNTFPIYWVDGDKVLVTSPKCLNGRNTAQYKVTVPHDKPQNYATSLDKTGAAGVQWGKEDFADFYSVYPADNASVQGTTFHLTMPNVQRETLELRENGQKANADMNACFMKAVSEGVANGHDVNLTYTPLSTAIRFTLRGPSSGVGQISEVTIIKVVLKADKPIAGDFTVDMSTGTVTPGEKKYYEITLYTYYPSTDGYLTLGMNEKNKEVELNAFVIPYKDLEVNDNWKLEVTTDQGKVFTTSLKEKGTGDGKLMPGRIHRFKGQLPSLPAPDKGWDPAKWMENIPRNVYLSEISIPGSWNSLNYEYQEMNLATKKKPTEKECLAAIEAQYKAGARAFHIDARWKAEKNSGSPGKLTLGVANGGSTRKYNGKHLMENDNMPFADALDRIVYHVQPKEYMVVFCTLAHDSYEAEENGWMKVVSEECANDDRIVDGRTISANTVVGDVLGKVIVIVNCPKNPTSISNLPTDSKCLFTYTPLELDESRYKKLDYCTGAITNCKDASLNMYSAQAQIMATLDATAGYTVDGRGYAPTLAEREQKTENILKWSLINYQNAVYAHSDWVYNGLGGSLWKKNTFLGMTTGYDEIEGSQKDVAQVLNPWIDDKIKLMSANPDTSQGQTRYYPVGLVLMNYVTNDTYGKPVLLDILSLNNKFRKAYDPNRDPLDPSNNGSSSDVNSAAPGYNSGMKDNGTDAIGWTRSH